MFERYFQKLRLDIIPLLLCFYNPPLFLDTLSWQGTENSEVFFLKFSH